MADKDASISDLNLFGAEAPDVQEYVTAREQGLKALEQRYANPNWFNVAAGFLKPQLGGFGASLGSANQALGEWQEKQRENLIPVSKMRSELALAKIALGQKLKAADVAQKAINAPGGPTLQDAATTTALGGAGAPTAQALTSGVAQRNADLETAAKALAVNNAGFVAEKTALDELAKLNQWTPEQRAEKLAGLISKWKSAIAPVARPAPVTPSGIAAAATPAGAGAVAPVAAGAVTPADVSLAGSDAAFDAALKPTIYTGTALSAEQIKSYEERAAKGDTLAEDILRAYRASPVGAAAEKEIPKPGQPTATGEKPITTQYKNTFGSNIRYTNDAQQAIALAAAAKTAETENKIAEKALENYRYLAQDTVRNSTTSAFDNVDRMYANPKTSPVISRISDAVKSAGVLAVLASQGTAVSTLGYGMQLSAPVQQAILATLPEADRAVAAQYMTYVGTIHAADLLTQGKTPTDKDIIESAGLNRPMSAQFNNAARAQARFKHALATNDVLTRELSEAQKTGSPAPYAEVLKQSNMLKVLNAARDKRIAKINEIEVNAMKGGKP